MFGHDPKLSTPSRYLFIASYGDDPISILRYITSDYLTRTILNSIMVFLSPYKKVRGYYLEIRPQPLPAAAFQIHNPLFNHSTRNSLIY
jgi:hypothetical protein